jgi:HPt (histidine-containing phosphotransfer) domain-containing protein
MMPEMDGVETVQKIRELGEQDEKYKKLTIIALTANAIAGVREMFLENGFNEFISKPIDAFKLQEMVHQYLPPEKVQMKADGENKNELKEYDKDSFLGKLQKISDIDIKIGLGRVSNVESMYRDSLEFFYRKLCGERDKMSDCIENGDFKLFSITVHAMKSSLSTVGVMGMSETAAKLETESKAGNHEYCIEQFPAFKEQLTALHESLETVFPNEQPDVEKEAGDFAHLAEIVKKAIAAADDFDSDIGLELVKDLLRFDFNADINEKLEKVKTAFGDFDCSGAAEILHGIEI